MKLIILVFAALILSSCGKNSGGDSKGQGIHEETGFTSPNGYVNVSNSSEIEFLNVTMRESIERSGDRIIFSRDASDSDQGNKITCQLSIKAGEIWHAQKMGSYMELENSQGKKIKLLPLSNRGTAEVWVWRGKENGLKLTRRYTFLPNQLIINQDCEG